MNTIYDERDYSGPGAVLALGMFDGVHLGHRTLISRAVYWAEKLKGDAMVCTFDRHPISVLSPGDEPMALTTPETRVQVFAQLGATWALVKPFTRELADQSPESFIESLFTHTRTKAVVCGENYTFGRGGAGDVSLLRKLAAEAGVLVDVPPIVRDGEQTVSSTLIRSLLKKGDFRLVKKLLGGTPILTPMADGHPLPPDIS